jgi:hypothetical protein
MSDDTAEFANNRAVGPIESELEFKRVFVALLLRTALLIKLDEQEAAQREAILEDIQLLRDYLDAQESA